MTSPPPRPPRYPASSEKHMTQSKLNSQMNTNSNTNTNAWLDTPEDRAEQGLLESVEARRATAGNYNNNSNYNNNNGIGTSSNGDQWQAVVQGERPPLPSVPMGSGNLILPERPTPMRRRHRSTSSVTMEAGLTAVAAEGGNPGVASRQQQQQQQQQHQSQPPPPHRPGDTTNTTGSHHSANSRRSRGSRSRESRGSLMSRQTSRKNVMAQPNFLEIAQKMRQLSSHPSTTTNFNNTNATTTATTATAAATSGNKTVATNPSIHSESTMTPPVAVSTSSLISLTAAVAHRRQPSKAHSLLEAISEKAGGSFLDHISSGHGHGSGHGGGHGGGGGGSISSSMHGGGGNIFDGIGIPGTPTDVGASSCAMEDTNTDQLITGAMRVEELFRDDTEEMPMEQYHLHPHIMETVTEQAPTHEELYPEVAANHAPSMIDLSASMNLDPMMTDDTLAETIPLTQAPSSYGSTMHSQDDAPKRSFIPEERRAALKQRRKSNSLWQLWKRRLLQCCCQPQLLLQWIYSRLAYNSFSFKCSVPFTILSWIFFTQFGDPSPDFLPGKASISWWLLFFARQCVTLDLTRVLQWAIVDVLLLSSRTAVRLLGPLFTLVAIQSKGWPFCSLTWSFVDLFAVHGTDHFQQHWLYWTGVDLYKYGNTGLYLLNSPTYTRILLAMIVAGMATASKRTIVALYFGRRTFVEFKPRLEKILREIIVLSEVAELGMEAEILEVAANQQHAMQMGATASKLVANDGGVGVGIGGGGRTRSTDLIPTVTWSPALATTGRHRVFSHDGNGDGGANGRGDHDHEDDDDDDDASTDAGSADNDEDGNSIQNDEPVSNRGGSHILYLLEQWDEPRNAMDKTSNASINDILKFRRALSFMDDRQPFGNAFGPAHSREAVVKSAEFVFRRLLTLTPENDALPFEALEMLAHEGDVDGPLDRSKLKTIKRMFRPDADNALSQIDFIKSCDNLYKKLRFFRASVGNASVIDHHLESIIDAVFYFILSLVLLSVTGLNPWPLLVSISTLLVSISFAVGASASKYIEGILLIAARRPYDLGDRIYMMNPSEINSDLGIMVSWFIEDINLFNTTVRYAPTNEVGTINNGAIANMRIINANRSPNAVVWYQLPFRTRILREGRMAALQAMLEKYAKEHPRHWHSYSYCRVDEVHSETDKLVITIGFQHRSSWQDLVSILNAKSELMCATLEYSKKEGINYEELPTRNMMYYAGQLKSGGYTDHRDSLHDPANIINDHGPLAMPQSTATTTTTTNSSDQPPTQPKANAEDEEHGGPNPTANDLFLSQLQQSHGH